MVYLSLPFFNELTGKALHFSIFKNLYTLPSLILLTVFVAFISGAYPALFLSSFEPAKVLKSNSATGKTGTLFRKILVTFQFTLSAILLIGTVLIFMQLKFIQEKDLGFDKNNVLLLPTKQNLIAWEFSTFKEQGLSHTQIQNISGIGKIPGSEKQEYYRYVPAGTAEGEDASNLVLHVTHGFTETFDLELVAGRSFSKEFISDANQNILINEKMLTQLDVDTPEEALGAPFYFYPAEGDRQLYTVIGVIEDFNYSSLKKGIEPLVIKLLEGTQAILGSVEHTAIEIAPGNPAPVLDHLEGIWKELNPIDPFEYEFLNDRLNRIYESEQTISSLASAFAILCIIIACLGLLGLASYSAQLKRKEIGIRKSLGASVFNIISLLSKEFLLLVALANLIAWPLTYYAASKWLENFSYSISLSSNLPHIFACTALTIGLFAIITVSYHSLKAATINPVEAIRNE